MIEATGVLTLVTDKGQPGVAVPDLVYGGEWAEPDSGMLYHKLLELVGKEVYVLVLPKDDMIVMCECGHIYADHLDFENWYVDRFSRSAHEPSLTETTSHISYYGQYPADNRYCKCRKFKKAT
jgi:hypothetical protein